MLCLVLSYFFPGLPNPIMHFTFIPHFEVQLYHFTQQYFSIFLYGYCTLPLIICIINYGTYYIFLKG